MIPPFIHLPISRYLYINVRPWPRDYHSLMTSASHPPPVGSKLDRYALDLGRMAFVSQQIHQQNAFVPSDPCFWNPLRYLLTYMYFT